MAAQDSPIQLSTAVGFQFVRQYYTVLNKDPSKLHCFYKKHSLLTHGDEGLQIEPVAGQIEINEKITSLGFQNCKVVVSQLDTQPSMNNSVVVSVLGEMSNLGGASRRFSQTFFLALEEAERYYVLNDVFRFLKDSGSPSQPTQDQTQHVPSAAPVLNHVEPVQQFQPVAEPEPVVEPVPEPTPEPVQEEQKPQEVPAEAPKVEEPKVEEPKPVAAPAPVAAAPTPKPAAAKPAPKQSPLAAAPAPKPSGPPTWASRAATSNPNQWGANASSLRGTVEALPEPKQEKQERHDRHDRHERHERHDRHDRHEKREREYKPRAHFDSEDVSAFVKDVTEDMEEDIKAAFSKFGTVTNVTFLKLNGSAFVDFDSPLSAGAAINSEAIQLPSGKLIKAERRNKPRGQTNARRHGKEFDDHRRSDRGDERPHRDHNEKPRRDHATSDIRKNNAPSSK